MQSANNELKIRYVDEDEAPVRKRTRVKQPRRLTDRSKYTPHSNKRECARRLRQIHEGQLEMDGVYEIWVELSNQLEQFSIAISETGQD